jgi:DNA invertase Pin-like site-specific DNA recombinase
MPIKMIGLIRVSTGKQGESGLGLEAQLSAIEEYRKRCDGILLRTYKEIESGKHDSAEDRPTLQAAVGHARRSKATLVIAKVDRLLRSIPMLAYIKKSGVEFVACDNPRANELTIDLLAVVAANERRAISTRTKEALAQYKQQGRLSKRVLALYPNGVPKAVARATAGRLGASLSQCRNLTPAGRVKGLARSAKVRQANAVEAYVDIAEYMHELRNDGHTLQEIATQLNSDGHTCRRGGEWSPTQVWRILKRLEGGA